jgi:hypothetical protein
MAEDPVTFGRTKSWTYWWRLRRWLTVALREEMQRWRDGEREDFGGKNDFGGKMIERGRESFTFQRCFFNFFFFFLYNNKKKKV